MKSVILNMYYQCIITVLNYYKTVIKSSIYIEYLHFQLGDLTQCVKNNLT